MKVCGLPATRHFKINTDQNKILETLQGIQLRPKGETITAQREKQETPFGRTNNTNIYNTNNNNNKIKRASPASNKTVDEAKRILMNTYDEDYIDMAIKGIDNIYAKDSKKLASLIEFKIKELLSP
jgi:hypothetical protein